jgi:hypothetical protein
MTTSVIVLALIAGVVFFYLSYKGEEETINTIIDSTKKSEDNTPAEVKKEVKTSVRKPKTAPVKEVLVKEEQVQEILVKEEPVQENTAVVIQETKPVHKEALPEVKEEIAVVEPVVEPVLETVLEPTKPKKRRYKKQSKK